ncbi:MAG: hypothetical protein ACKVS6_11900 [Planctomycetota bacterium]
MIRFPRFHVFLILALTLAPVATLSAQTVYVTTVSDVVDFGGLQRVNNLPGPDGKVSMREAAIASNNTAGAQTIGFQVPAGQWGSGTFGPEIINAGDPFPIHGNNTTVDGTTQTAFTGDLNPTGAEVSFRSTTTDVQLIVTGIFEITADLCLFKGLGDMTNRSYGLDFRSTAEFNVVTGCVIKGKFAAIRIQGDRNTIGGVLPGEGNTLWSLSDGLRIHGLAGSVAKDNVVIGNTISGEFNGVQIVGDATGNRIGGFAPGERNFISGAGYFQEDGTPDGALIRIESDANFVYGNFLGTDSTGTIAMNNPADVGVEIYGDNNIVRGNVIGGITGLVGPLSVQAGISLREDAQQNVIQGNWIGVDMSGVIAIPNTVGIRISAFDSSFPMPGENVIGGAGLGEGNVIAHNETGGIVILLDSIGNRISGNQIRDNHTQGGLGIDLGGDGPTPNDLGDGDTGPNLLMNQPAILSAVTGVAGTVVTGHVDMNVATVVRVEFFSNPAPAPNEIVEAATYLGAVDTAADGSFAAVLPLDTTGLAITAIAIDPAGNTSEISTHVLSSASPWTDLGQGLAGTNGIAVLTGAGTLAHNTQMGLVLTGALPNTVGIWIAGTSAANMPLEGGILVPSPDENVIFSTDSNGDSNFLFTWPPTFPPGTTVYVQAWFIDAGSIGGLVAASNAIVAVTP